MAFPKSYITSWIVTIQELLAEIRAGQIYTVDRHKKRTTIKIPVTDELQVKITKNGKNSNIVLEPIPSETLQGSIHLKVKVIHSKTYIKDT